MCDLRIGGGAVIGNNIMGVDAPSSEGIHAMRNMGIGEWTANASYLAEIVNVFRRAGSPDRAVQQEVAAFLGQLSQLPDAACYLAWILCCCSGETAEVRQVAGLALKNSFLINRGSSSPQVSEVALKVVKPLLLEALRDPSKTVRRTAGSVVTTLIQMAGARSWPEALDALAHTLNSPAIYSSRPEVTGSCNDGINGIATGVTINTIGGCNSNGTVHGSQVDEDDDSLLDGALSALCKICEDELMILVAHPAVRTHRRPGSQRTVAPPPPAPPATTYLSSGGSLVQNTSASPATIQNSTQQPNNSCNANDECAAFFIDFCRVQLLPKLFFFCNPVIKPFCRRYAASCLLIFAQAHTFAQGAVFENMFPQYWTALGALATDSHPDIRKTAVQGMILVVDLYPEVICKSADAVYNFIADSCSDPDYGLRLEALEFWPAILKYSTYQPDCYTQAAVDMIKGHLPKLLPILVENTVYTEWDYLGMDKNPVEDDNATVPDDSQDLKPRFHHTKTYGKEETHDDEDDDCRDDEKRGTWGGGWTVRKGSALALDNMAATYMEDILPIVLPLVEKRFVAPSWEVRESAVLTLGAIAPGCMRGLSPCLPKVLEFLLKLCDDPKPLLRSISCWCVSRFSCWVCHPSNEEIWLRPVLAQILKHVIDKNKRVQEAACSAFATFEEEARHLLEPFLPEIISTVRQAFQFYQAKNLLILYDAVGTLAETVGFGLQKDEYVKDLIEPLFNKLQEVKSNDSLCIALFECITCCTVALKESFAPYAVAVIKKCKCIVESTLDDIKRFESGQTPDKPNSDMMECSLDLLSGITGGLGEKLYILLCNKELLGNEQMNHMNSSSETMHFGSNESINFVPVVERCCVESRAPTVLQSSFALIGDLSKHCIQFLKPHLPIIIPKLAEYLLHPATSVSNNAGWAIGEICMRAGTECIENHVELIAKQLIKSMSRAELHRSLLQNVCITLGRLGLVCPDKMAIYLPQFLKSWCRIMIHAHNDEEKTHAFQGICNILMNNLSAASECIMDLLVAMRSCSYVNEEMQAQFDCIIYAIRENFPQNWEIMWNNAGSAFQEDLRGRFNIR